MNGADCPISDQLPDVYAQREITSPNSLHEKQVLLPGNLYKLLGLRGIDREGLLAEHVLPGLETEHDILEMVGVGSGDVDYVYIPVMDEFGVRAIGLSDGWTSRLL